MKFTLVSLQFAAWTLAELVSKLRRTKMPDGNLVFDGIQPGRDHFPYHHFVNGNGQRSGKECLDEWKGTVGELAVLSVSVHPITMCLNATSIHSGFKQFLPVHMWKEANGKPDAQAIQAATMDEIQLIAAGCQAAGITKINWFCGSCIYEDSLREFPGLPDDERKSRLDWEAGRIRQAVGIFKAHGIKKARLEIHNGESAWEPYSAVELHKAVADDGFGYLYDHSHFIKQGMLNGDGVRFINEEAPVSIDAEHLKGAKCQHGGVRSTHSPHHLDDPSGRRGDEYISLHWSDGDYRDVQVALREGEFSFDEVALEHEDGKMLALHLTSDKDEDNAAVVAGRHARSNILFTSGISHQEAMAKNN